MSSRKNIIFFVKDENHTDVSRLKKIIIDNSAEYVSGMRGSCVYYIEGSDIWWHIPTQNWEYFGIDVDYRFKDFKIIAHITDDMDYDNPEVFQEESIKCFNIIKEKLDKNSIYVTIYDDSSSRDCLIYLPILDDWKGNLYDVQKQRDDKINTLLNDKD